MARKYMDCRDAPNVAGCTLRISGEENEVVRAAAEHAASVHQEKDTPKFREELRRHLKDESEFGESMSPYDVGDSAPVH